MDYLTTGQAAKLLSVTPATVFKWIKSGKFAAIQTAGGHYRIARKIVEDMISHPEKRVLNSEYIKDNKLIFCWEFFSEGGAINDGCLNCIVYKARAHKCYEMNDLPKDAGYKGIFCSSSCMECPYFKEEHVHSYNVLVITENKRIKELLPKPSRFRQFNFLFTTHDCDPSASLVNFLPDCVIINSAKPSKKSSELCKYLRKDPRISGARIINAVPQEIKSKLTSKGKKDKSNRIVNPELLEKFICELILSETEAVADSENKSKTPRQ